MVLKILLDTEVLKLDKLEYVLSLFNIQDVEFGLVGLLVILIEKTSGSIKPELTGDTDVTFHEFLINCSNKNLGDYANNKAILLISEYVEFFENNITIKILMHDLREKLNGVDYFITDYYHDTYNTNILLSVRLER